jgi:hypothetical protein
MALWISVTSLALLLDKPKREHELDMVAFVGFKSAKGVDTNSRIRKRISWAGGDTHRSWRGHPLVVITAADAMADVSAASRQCRLYRLIRFIDWQWRSSGSSGDRQDEECLNEVGRYFRSIHWNAEPDGRTCSLA